ncbi:MAG: DUF362 domain-containing protein [Candidatus Neomarinimicrobiota bacterium]|jgi:uncharacterized protein (DUF362 family)/Pyruvate/2-oxoacid:ferredoxin oxidoreductase delta subunit
MNRSEPDISNKVSVRRVERYRGDQLLQAVSEMYTAAGGPDPKGKKILLKPNILADVPPERAVTTHPSVFRAVAYYLLERGALVLAGDSPAIHNPLFAAKGCGIQQVCRELKIPWIDFIEDSFSCKGFRLAGILKEVDYVFSLAKCKTHEFAYYTGAVKNLFGLIPGFSKAMMHAKYPNRQVFAAMVVDLLNIVKPDFAVMDAVIAMEGAGPQNGQPRHLGLLLASTNSVALDVSMAQIIGYDPLDIPILANALQRGIQLKDIGDIILEGGVLKDFRVKNFKRIAIERKYNFVYMGVRFEQLRRRFDRRPVFDHDRCILCQKCVQMCKAEALKVRDGKITIHDPNCIRCYCCHEVCPVSAIDIKRKVFG